MKRLESHSSLAIDMDFTLVNGDNSHHLRNYLEKHHQSKTFYIVTFRNEQQAADIAEELRRENFDPRIIADVIHCPLNYGAVWLKMQAKHLSFMKMRAEAQTLGIRLEDIESLVDEFCHWKGKVAAGLGCTVLVDDLPDLVLPGCQRHGVQFLNAEHLVWD